MNEMRRWKERARESIEQRTEGRETEAREGVEKVRGV